MTNEELSEIVTMLRGVGDDHIDVEAKASQTELPKQLWHSLSAFANTLGGGVILLGLDERSGFQTVGVQRPKQIQQDLANLCDQMEPPLRAQIRPHVFEGKTLIVAEIPEVDRSQKPCFYKGAGHLNGAPAVWAGAQRDEAARAGAASTRAGAGQPYVSTGHRAR